MNKFSDDEFSVYVGNLDCRIPLADLEELLYELFLQAGPVDKVYFPSDPKTGWHKCYGFVEFEHKESVPYSIQLLDGILFFQRPLKVRPAAKNADSMGQANALPVSTPSDSTEQHPTLGQRLSPPPTDPAPLQDKPLDHSLAQRLSPPRPLFPSTTEQAAVPTVSSIATLPLPPFLPPPPHLLFPPPSSGVTDKRLPLPPFPPAPLPSFLPPPPSHLRPEALANIGPSLPAPHPIPPFTSRTEDPPSFGTDHSMPRPLFPHPPVDFMEDGVSSPESMPRPFFPPPPVDFTEDAVMSPNPDHAHFDIHMHANLHQNRILRFEEKPSWVSEETKQQIRDHHLRQLEKTLNLYQQQYVTNGNN